jgi:two-component system, LytTR family, response regulator
MNPYKLTISTSEGTYFFKPEEIIRLEASSNYTHIYFTNHKMILAAKVLKDFAAQLEPFGFIRTHRSHLINSQYVLSVDTSGQIIMEDASVAEFSRRMKKVALKALKKAA